MSSDDPPPGPEYPGQYGQYGQYGYCQQPPWAPTPPPYGFQAPPPKHPSAVTALVLGIISVAGVLCCIGPIVGPFAWWLGHRSVAEIDLSGGRLSGRSEAAAGRVLGIIGTVLLLLVIAYWGLILTLAFSGF